MRRFGRRLEVEKLLTELPVRAYFFDCLRLDDRSLADRPLRERSEALAAALPETLRVQRIVTSSVQEARAFYEAALAADHEGVMAKSLDSLYEAGNRGASWLKIKRAHTLDLVVLAAEWGHGRRTGKLSNLHLGALDRATGHYVMLGKTFKGLTDAMLEGRPASCWRARHIATGGPYTCGRSWSWRSLQRSAGEQPLSGRHGAAACAREALSGRQAGGGRGRPGGCAQDIRRKQLAAEQQQHQRPVAEPDGEPHRNRDPRARRDESFDQPGAEEQQRAGMSSGPSSAARRRRDSVRVASRGRMSDSPSAVPAAAARHMTDSSTGPCARMNLTSPCARPYWWVNASNPPSISPLKEIM